MCHPPIGTGDILGSFDEMIKNEKVEKSQLTKGFFSDKITSTSGSPGDRKALSADSTNKF